MAEELVLPASVSDKFSRPLQDLQRRLRDFKATPGLAAIEKHFVGLRKQIEAATGAIRSAGNGLASGLGLPGLSIGALSAASAMAALGASVQSFAKNTVDIRKFTQETGIAGQKLKELKAVAAGLGIDESVVQGGLVFGAQNYAALKRGQGNYADIANLRGGGQSIANELKGAKDANDYTERGLGILNRQKTAEQRRVLSRLIFGTEEYSPFGANGIEDLNQRRKAARASIGGQTSQDEKNAEKFLDASSKISASIEKLTNAVGGALAPHITELAEALNKLGNEHMGDVQGFFDSVGKALREHDWKADGVAINTAIEAFKTFFDELNKFKSGADSVADAFHKADMAVTKWVEDHAKALVTDDPLAGKKPGERGDEDRNPLYNSPLLKALPPATGDEDGNVHKMAYRPGARMAAAGIASATNSMAVATIAAGVTKGMQDFAASLQGGGDGAGGGLTNAAYHPGEGGILMGGGGRGGSLSYGSAGVKVAVARGNLAKNQREAYAAARAEGLSHEAALAWVANTSGESLADPANRTGDGGRAQGIVQWHGDRAKAIKDKYGLFPYQMSVADQTKAGLDEMKRKYPKSWKILTDPNSSTEEKLAALVNDYERPANKPKSYRERLGFLKGLPKDIGSRDVANRPSASKTKAKSDAQAAGKDGANGRVDIHVHSKDQPVDMKTNGSPVFGETKLNRGKSVGLMDI
ncbi:hypothetical protein J8I29_06700 [Labrys sp. LIt4]|uniref:phage tail tip lysozyme n=1 Tax=Labrys sp. LIt4 TaxID=2821355 RepID=UPI001ADFD84E|nr:phage tail tip lysozyme [Labrys sp. LIt4]MBP0578987.1 hypothetical protein [Labrys sp. LIt4]